MLTRYLYYLLFFVYSAGSLRAYTFDSLVTTQAPTTQKITLDIKLEPQELLLKDSLHVTSPNTQITLSQPVTDQQSSSHDTSTGYADHVRFILTAQNDNVEPSGQVPVEVAFKTTAHPEEQKKVISLTFGTDHNTNCSVNQPALLGSFTQQITQWLSSTFGSWKNGISNLFETAGSRWARLLAALILGILLSLTPCIYPMIPITVGILQSSEKKSFIRNFAVALAYTLGISCTFAALGFVTALGSCVFGELQNTAWLVLPLIGVLIYLGLAMFGLYDMYVPKFLKPKDTQVKGGSFVSAFVFGAISGTVASPCLSPGLALILAHVAKITQQAHFLNYLDGFFTLFAFGVGSSLPLLIIGTFSNSLSVLPRAGMWMVEVKKLLGLMLLGMAFYHLEKFVPWPILVWFVAAFLFAVGVYYFISLVSYDSKGARIYKKLAGTVFIVASCIMIMQGVKARYPAPQSTQSFWITDYTQAQAQALKEHKKLLLDFVTSSCVSCKVLEKTIFSNPQVQTALANYIPVKIDGSDTGQEPFKTLSQQLDIKGFPTVIIYDPVTKQPIKQWIGEVGSVNEFIAELHKIT